MSLYEWVVLYFALCLGSVTVLVSTFLVANWLGLAVDEIGFGVGPAVLQKSIGQAKFVLCEIPLPQEFVRLSDANVTPAQHPTRELFTDAAIWKKALLLLPGPIIQLACGIALLALSDGSQLINSLGLLCLGCGLLHFVPSPLTQGGRVLWELYAFARGVQLDDRLKEMRLLRFVLVSFFLWLTLFVSVLCFYSATVGWLHWIGFPIAI